MAKGPARTFGQDLMRGEHVVGAGPASLSAAPQNGGVLMPSHTSGDPSFYTKKRAKEAELGRELTTEEFLADHYAASDAPTASGTSIFDPVLCEIAYRWFCPPGGTVLARAAAWLMGIDRWDNARWEALEEQIGPARPATTPAGQPERPQPQSAPKRPTSWLGPRRGKWL